MTHLWLHLGGACNLTNILAFIVHVPSYLSHFQTGEVKCHIQNSAEDSLTCGAWCSDGYRFYVGGNRGQFYQCVSAHVLSDCHYMYDTTNYRYICLHCIDQFALLLFPPPSVQSMDGSVTDTWEGVRVKALATHPSSDIVFAADTHSRIRQYNFSDKSSSTM